MQKVLVITTQNRKKGNIQAISLNHMDNKDYSNIAVQSQLLQYYQIGLNVLKLKN